MRGLLKRTVHTAVDMGLEDMAVQAVDGTKIAGNAAKARTYDAAGLQRLLDRTEAAIGDLEAHNEAGEDGVPVRLPEQLSKKQALREQVRAAMKRLASQEGHERINLTDGDAGLMKSRQGIVAGYNAQAMVSPLDQDEAGGSGLMITAAEVVKDPDDHALLVPMLKEAEDIAGERADSSLADAGYHSGPNLEACEQRSQRVTMPEAQNKALKNPYHKAHFAYDEMTDTYTCPQGQRLHFTGLKQRSERPTMRVYRGSGAICRVCPAFGMCTKDHRQGRALEIGPYEAMLRSHREWIATDQAKAAYKQRKELPEPAFGILKERHGARRFLLRGLRNVGAEWKLLATAFNLRTLCQVWSRRLGTSSTWAGLWSSDRSALTAVAVP